MKRQLRLIKLVLPKYLEMAPSRLATGNTGLREIYNIFAEDLDNQLEDNPIAEQFHRHPF